MYEGTDTLKFICSCGTEHRPVLNDHFNYKDGIDCNCGRKFIIIEIEND